MRGALHQTHEQPQSERADTPKRVALERVEVSEGGCLATEECLNRLLRERREHQTGKVQLRLPAQGRNEREHEQPNEEKEDGVPDEVIVSIMKDLPEGYAKGRPDSTQPVEWEPERGEQRKDCDADPDDLSAGAWSLMAGAYRR